MLPLDAKDFYRKFGQVLWSALVVSVLAWAIIVALLYVDQIQHGTSARHCCVDQPK